jgi:N-methylhydantoinase A
MWSIGTDTGGTFTDLVALTDDGQIAVSKTPSTPPNFEQGVVDAVTEVGIAPDDIRVLHHGTTVTTNALLTRNGAKTALLCTEGFRDILYIRTGSRGEAYDINWDPPEAMVPRFDRLPVAERVAADGEVLTPLDEDAVRAAGELWRKRGIEAIAVCFLHSYANPAHEHRALEILAEVHPEAYLCASADILPEPPEFPRTSTTVANAYVGPVLERYMAQLESAVKKIGYDGSVRIMHSGGGNMTPDGALRLPVRTATSGPAAGVMAAAMIAKAAGRANVVTLDMGGTSADIATIRDGKPTVTVEQTVEWGLPIGFPAVDLIAIGAGGGSIAWVDEGGAPHVGPQSAGALPGPACYQRGGVEPTTSDANLLLGRVREESLLGGGMKMDTELAREAIATKFAEPLGLSVEDAAEGIVRIANEHMAHGIRRMTIQKGLDPREFSLVAFGGAGPMHAIEIAQVLEIPEVIVPAHPGTTSALGLLAVDTRHDLVHTFTQPYEEVDPAAVEAELTRMETEARDLLEAEGFEPATIMTERYVDVRYVGQIRALTLAVGAEEFDGDAKEALAERFHTEYEEEFKYAVPELPIETKSLRVSAIGLTSKPELVAGESVGGDAETAKVGEGEVRFGGVDHTTPYYRRELLAAGTVFSGPAIVEQYDSTTIVPPDTSVEVDGIGNLIVTIGAGAKDAA